MARDLKKKQDMGAANALSGAEGSENGHAAPFAIDPAQPTLAFPANGLATAAPDIEVTRPKRNRLRILLPLLALLLVAAGVGWWLLSSQGKAVATATVRRGTIVSTVETTGRLQAAVSAQLSFKVPGQVWKVLAKEGDLVRSGQVLAELDTAGLERGLQEAEVQLEISRLKLLQAQEGAREEDLAAAAADLNAATARLNNVKAGSRVEEIAAAQAAYDQAVANLDAVKSGATKEDLAAAEATLRQAQARLEQARMPATKEQIGAAEATLREAQAKYDALKAGATQAEIAGAQAALDEAKANLGRVKAGATKEDLAAAKARLDQATNARAGVAANASNAKEQARLDVEIASHALQNVQDVYGKIKDENSQKKPEEITGDDRNREAKALRDVQDAEARVQQATLAYDTARKNEVAQLAQADASIREAQAALDKLKAGPTAEEIRIAQAGVDQAQAKLDALKAGPKPQDLAAAQAGVDAAQANLDRLKAGGTAAEIAAAHADVDKAQAALDKLKAGPTAEEIRIAQAGVDQARAKLDMAKRGATPEEIKEAQAHVDAAQAGLDKLKAGPSRTDLGILEQGIVLSEIAVESAESQLADARLTSPIAGTVLSLDVEVGESVAAMQNAAVVADINTLRVKADVDELDVGRVSVGQVVTITLDAYPGVKMRGTIDKLAPGATQKQGSTVYEATILFTPAEGVVPREGMAASVDITAQRKDDVLLLPNRAFETVGNRQYVTVREASGAQRKVEVETGLSNNAETEVISGLEEGQVVLVR